MCCPHSAADGRLKSKNQLVPCPLRSTRGAQSVYVGLGSTGTFSREDNVAFWQSGFGLVNTVTVTERLQSLSKFLGFNAPSTAQSHLRTNTARSSKRKSVNDSHQLEHTHQFYNTTRHSQRRTIVTFCQLQLIEVSHFSDRKPQTV